MSFLNVPSVVRLGLGLCATRHVDMIQSRKRTLSTATYVRKDRQILAKCDDLEPYNHQRRI